MGVDEALRSGDEYEVVLLLDELESLLEDVEEHPGDGPLPRELEAQMRELGVKNITQLRKRIRELHGQLDVHDI